MKDWILVDGKRRPTRNAEGRAIHAKEAGIRAFWRWFGDSKITDEKGRPLVLYHGTPAEFDQFRVAPSGMAGAGIYFTPDPTTAGHYATTKGGIVPVYLRILRPRVFASAKEAVDAFFADLGDYSGGEADQEVMRRNIQHGYDGIIISVPRLRMRADQYPEFVVFSPNQAKSVYNRGSFDPSDPTLSNPVAYHASRRHFKRFSTMFLGSGTGRAALGPGIYLTNDKAIAEHYRSQLDGPVYTVDVPPSTALLQADKTMAKQPASVKAALKSEGLLQRFSAHQVDFAAPSGTRVNSGWGFYQFLSFIYGSDAAAADVLKRLGIPGMEFASEDPVKGKAKKARNYVIWDESALEIIRTNPNRSTTMTWKPYQITFKKSPRGRTLVWVRFGQRQDSALLSAKRAVREYYPKATGFTIRPYRGRLNPPQDVLANPYCTMCNPYPNEHAARIRDPKSIRPDTYRSKTIAGHGIRLIIGKLKRYPKKQPKRGTGARKADPMVVQAIRFKRTAWTPAQAKAWLREHSFKPKMFEPARGK